MKFQRVWAMPSEDTFSIEPIAGFVQGYLLRSKVSIDPFARNRQWFTHTNDLNPNTAAQFHLDAEEFLKQKARDGVRADLIIFDPPYSPRQIKECYESIGREVTTKDTQSAGLYSRVRDAILPLCEPETVVLSFGWNSVGMGGGRAFDLESILLVCHGGAHNDTICIAERKRRELQQTLYGPRPMMPGAGYFGQLAQNLLKPARK